MDKYQFFVLARPTPTEITPETLGEEQLCVHHVFSTRRRQKNGSVKNKGHFRLVLDLVYTSMFVVFCILKGDFSELFKEIDFFYGDFSIGVRMFRK